MLQISTSVACDTRSSIPLDDALIPRSHKLRAADPFEHPHLLVLTNGANTGFRRCEQVPQLDRLIG